MRTLYGLEVVQNPHAVTLVPNKEHRINPKRRASYHARIQKKWNKRHGLKTVPGIFRTGDRFIIHPELYVKLLAEVDRTNALEFRRVVEGAVNLNYRGG